MNQIVRFNLPRQVTRAISVVRDNSYRGEEPAFRIQIGRSEGGGGMSTQLTREDIAALIEALQEPDSWPLWIRTTDGAA